MPSRRTFYIQREGRSVTLTADQIANLRLAFPDLTFSRKLSTFPKSTADALIHVHVASLISSLAGLFDVASFQKDENAADVSSVSERLASSVNIAKVTASSFSRTKVEALLSSDADNNFIGSKVFETSSTGNELLLSQYIYEELDEPTRKNGVTLAQVLAKDASAEYCFVEGDLINILVGVVLPAGSFNLSYSIEITPSSA